MPATGNRAEAIASESNDDPLEPRTTQQQQSHDKASGSQMENDLEISKENKVHTNDPKDVAGREGKGLGMLHKLVPGKN